MYNQYGRFPRLLHGKNGEEFVSKQMRLRPAKRHMGSHTSVEYQRKENSIAARAHQKMLNAMRAVVDQYSLPPAYRDDALVDDTFKMNIVRHRSISTSPLIVWHLAPPDMPQRFPLGALATIPIH